MSRTRKKLKRIGTKFHVKVRRAANRDTRAPLTVEELEGRCLLAVLWPLAPQNAQHEVMSSYGNYQELTVGLVDYSIHFHEGLDLVADPGDQVHAVAAGEVDGVLHGDTQYTSFITTRDPGGPADKDQGTG